MVLLRTQTRCEWGKKPCANRVKVAVGKKRVVHARPANTTHVL